MENSIQDPLGLSIPICTELMYTQNFLDNAPPSFKLTTDGQTWSTKSDEKIWQNAINQ